MGKVILAFVVDVCDVAGDADGAAEACWAWVVLEKMKNAKIMAERQRKTLRRENVFVIYY